MILITDFKFWPFTLFYLLSLEIQVLNQKQSLKLSVFENYINQISKRNKQTEYEAIEHKNEHCKDSIYNLLSLNKLQNLAKSINLDYPWQPP